ncbi:MAG: hypothetical protein HY908_08585 [Myxococcales bacterium]|nr:hypothetical protein [Myxococcales bacterium]
MRTPEPELHERRFAARPSRVTRGVVVRRLAALAGIGLAPFAFDCGGGDGPGGAPVNGGAGGAGAGGVGGAGADPMPPSPPDPVLTIDEAYGTTYFVRIDGGDEVECTGLVDAAYPGAGSGAGCAWNHPFVALPPGGSPRFAGGDRLIIGPGSYRMGLGAPGTSGCDSVGSWDCVAPPLPSGPDADHPTRVYGAGWDTGCAAPPELWGAERATQVLDLRGSSNLRLDCLELTDHDTCVEFHSGGLACERDTPPYGDWAETGIEAGDSHDVFLRRLDIHGLSNRAVHAGRLADWTVVDVRNAANGMVGWDGDIEGDDGNSGTMRFARWTVEWNGCAETYPGGAPTGCWAQEAGGYGDGVGTGETGGDWLITDSVFSFNTSDGLDLLYHRRGGWVRVERVRAEGNAGNQLKITGNAIVANDVLVGNCSFFDGQVFTHLVDSCRALGTALHLSIGPGDRVGIANNTIYSEGDCLVGTGDCMPGLDGTESLRSRNNIYLGDTDFLQPFERSCLFYADCPGPAFEQDHDVVFDVKDGFCPTGAANLCEDPALANPDPVAFDAHLQTGSPALDSGAPTDELVPSVDFEGQPRPSGPAVDRGAYEMP